MSRKSALEKIAVIGDGSWGTTLAVYLAKRGFPVTLWGAFEENIQAIRKEGMNTRFLPGIPIPPTVTATTDLEEALSPELLILAVPSQYVRATLKKLGKFDVKNKMMLSVVKGIDTNSLQRISEMILEETGIHRLAVLSGPTIAMEVVREIPSTAVIAAKNPALARKLQAVMNSTTFRIYTNTDIIGLELAGSLKNIIAIAAGVCDGLGYGTNTKAAILTRGLVEIARLGVAMGAQNKTFWGLAGLGDLVTTCSSTQSRNRYVGEQLGHGKHIQEILSSMNMVAEGVVTAKAAYRLSRKHHVAMPITTEVYNIIYKKKNPLKAVADLMNRAMKSE